MAGFGSTMSRLIEDDREYYRDLATKKRDYLQTYGTKAVLDRDEKANGAVSLFNTLVTAGIPQNDLRYVLNTTGVSGLAELKSTLSTRNDLTPSQIKGLVEKSKDYVAENPNEDITEVMRRAYGLYKSTDNPVEQETNMFAAVLGLDSRMMERDVINDIYVDGYTGTDIYRIMGSSGPKAGDALTMNLPTKPPSDRLLATSAQSLVDQFEYSIDAKIAKARTANDTAEWTRLEALKGLGVDGIFKYAIGPNGDMNLLAHAARIEKERAGLITRNTINLGTFTKDYSNHVAEQKDDASMAGPKAAPKDGEKLTPKTVVLDNGTLVFGSAEEFDAAVEAGTIEAEALVQIGEGEVSRFTPPKDKAKTVLTETLVQTTEDRLASGSAKRISDTRRLLIDSISGPANNRNVMDIIYDTDDAIQEGTLAFETEADVRAWLKKKVFSGPSTTPGWTSAEDETAFVKALFTTYGSEPTSTLKEGSVEFKIDQLLAPLLAPLSINLRPNADLTLAKIRDGSDEQALAAQERARENSDFKEIGTAISAGNAISSFVTDTVIDQGGLQWAEWAETAKAAVFDGLATVADFGSGLAGATETQPFALGLRSSADAYEAKAARIATDGWSAVVEKATSQTVPKPVKQEVEQSFLDWFLKGDQPAPALAMKTIGLTDDDMGLPNISVDESKKIAVNSMLKSEMTSKEYDEWVAGTVENLPSKIMAKIKALIAPTPGLMDETEGTTEPDAEELSLKRVQDLDRQFLADDSNYPQNLDPLIFNPSTNDSEELQSAVTDYTGSLPMGYKKQVADAINSFNETVKAFEDDVNLAVPAIINKVTTGTLSGIDRINDRLKAIETKVNNTMDAEVDDRRPAFEELKRQFGALTLFPVKIAGDIDTGPNLITDTQFDTDAAVLEFFSPERNAVRKSAIFKLLGITVPTGDPPITSADIAETSNSVDNSSRTGIVSRPTSRSPQDPAIEASTLVDEAEDKFFITPKEAVLDTYQSIFTKALMQDKNKPIVFKSEKEARAWVESNYPDSKLNSGQVRNIAITLFSRFRTK